MVEEVGTIDDLIQEESAVAQDVQQLPPVLAAVERLQRMTVCTRPFRAVGPRIELERAGGKTIVHNYGHGGSGWSLSWGSAARVRRLLQGEPAGEAAVIGCGAVGLTTALTLQRAGFAVRIFAQEFPPAVRSSRATGSWTPDARVALAEFVTEQFVAEWEEMARASFAEYARSLHLPGEPVKILPRYLLSELAPEAALAQRVMDDPIGFAHLEARIADLWPAAEDLSPEHSPFAGLYARRSLLFRFDVTAYSEHLLSTFLAAGGATEQRTFHDWAEVLQLPYASVVNCTGYGARALLGDDSVVPIRGQIGWLPAQPEVEYSLQFENLNMVARPDGIVVQLGAGGDASGWQDDGEIADHEETVSAVHLLRELQARACQTKESDPFSN